jgi:hypothetical protein
LKRSESVSPPRSKPSKPSSARILLARPSYLRRVAEGGREAFEDLPERVFLDSSTLQTLLDYGGPIFEGEAPEPGDRADTLPGFIDDLEALRRILKVVERGSFHFALSQNSLDEVAGKRDLTYARWALDVLDHWLISLDESGGLSQEDSERAAILDEPRFGYLSAKDKLLLRDAIAFDCDAFLTMEKRLAKNALHLRSATQLRVLRPPDYWSLIEPWAALFL